MALRMGTQNRTSIFHNLGGLIPILRCYTSKNLWWNSLIICIQIFYLNEGQKFDPFHVRFFQYFQWLSEWEQKSALLDAITWVVLLRFESVISL